MNVFKALLFITLFILLNSEMGYTQDNIHKKSDSINLQYNTPSDDLYDLSISTPSRKSVGTARLTAFTATFATAGMGIIFAATRQDSPKFPILAGFIIGPSAGSVYATDWSGVARGFAYRTAAAGMIYAGLHWESNNEGPFGSEVNSYNDLVLISGTLFMGARIIYDIFTTSEKSVDKFNGRLDKRSRFSVAPFANPAGKKIGLHAKISF